MTTTAVRDVATLRPLARRGDARAHALVAYDLLLALLEDLDPDDWGRRVPDCPAWTVADCVGHMIGAAKGHANPVEMVRQLAVGRRRRHDFDGNDTDAMNDLQVRDHADLTPPQRIAALRQVAPRAVAGRMRLPRILRGVELPIAQSGSWGPHDPSSLQLGRLMDATLTRDVWMHRLDIARATGREVVLDHPTDARIVEDVVAEWCARHGQPVDLVLDGPAGGTFRAGTAGPRLQLDVVAFVRALSGRDPGEGLLATHVLF